MPVAKALGWLAAAAALGVTSAAVVFDVLAHGHGETPWVLVLASAAVVASAAVGLLIVVRRGSHPVAWALLANAILLSLGWFASAYAAYAVLEHPGTLGGRWAVLWDDSDWPTLFAGMTAVALVFPTGRLLSPRWRWLGVAAVVSFAGALVAGVLDPARFQAPYGAVESPLPSVRLGWFEAPFFLGIFASLIATAVAVVVRLRRADGVERQQMLWLAYAACLIPLGLIVCVVEAAVPARRTMSPSP